VVLPTSDAEVTHGKIDAAAEDGFTEEVTEEVNGGGFSTAARANAGR
jgi:hypothetical protein